MRRGQKIPTNTELSILRVLWARGPSTVREVAVEMGRGDAYTTILKMLQIMTGKQLVRRNVSSRSHVYEAASTQHETQRQLVADLIDKAFGGSAARLVVQALSSTHASPAELAEIRKLVARRRKEAR